MLINKQLFIQKSFGLNEFDVDVKECGTLFNNALKKIYHHVINANPFGTLKTVSKAKADVGKAIFIIAKLASLFRSSQLLHILGKQNWWFYAL